MIAVHTKDVSWIIPHPFETHTVQNEDCANEFMHRWTSVGEASSKSLHSGKVDLMRALVDRSRRWSVSDPQVLHLISVASHTDIAKF